MVIENIVICLGSYSKTDQPKFGKQHQLVVSSTMKVDLISEIV
jgi:hypothetical protein